MDLDGTTVRVIRVEIKGDMIGPCDNWKPRFTVSMADKTDGENKPILCFLPGMSDENSGIFRITGTETIIPHRFATLADWAPAYQIPLDALVFPAGGTRTVEVLFGIQLGERILTAATTSVRVNAAGRGYEQMAQDQRRIDRLTIELAMAVSAADGSLDEDEARIVKAFASSRIEAAPAGIASAVKDELNESVRRGASALRENRVPALCSEMVAITDPAQRYSVLELGLRIASVDQRADPGELRVLKMIARGLELDMDRFKAMMDKELPIQFHEDKSVESVLGITPSMTSAQVNNKLNEEFRKWNARATHEDPKIREQAQQMVTLIAEAKDALRG